MSPLVNTDYMLGEVRTDRGKFIDKGNLWVDPRHTDFDGGITLVNSTTDATTDIATKNTRALVKAIATGMPIRMPRGVVPYNGGELILNTIGQHFIGSGMSDGSLNQGTVMHKMAAGFGLKVRQTEHKVTDLTFSGNDLAGSQLYCDATHRGHFARLGFRNQGDSDYALYLGGDSVVNICLFHDLHFFDTGTGNYGNIKIDNAFYCLFDMITAAGCTGPYSVDIGGSGATVASVIAFRAYHNDTGGTSGILHLGSLSSQFRGYGLSCELDVATQPWIHVEEATDTVINGVHIQRGAQTVACIKVTGNSYGTFFQGMEIRDTGSLSGQHMVELDDAPFTAFRDVMVYSNNAFDFVKVNGTRVDDLLLDNVHYRSGAAGTNDLKCANATIRKSNMNVEFQSGNDSTSLYDVTGTITTANANILRVFGQGALGVSGDQGDNSITATVGQTAPTIRYGTALTAPRTITLATTDVPNGSKFRVVRQAAATGASGLAVGTGPLKTLALGEWCDVEYNGSAWILTAFGAL